MIVTIASGKGGTGKTTVATNLALSLGEKVVLLDCDVEEPNAHLFMNPDIGVREPATTMVPVFDNELCTGCKKCSEICRFNALAVVGGGVLAFPELCHSCGGCLEVCPEGAVSEGSRELGVVESGLADGLMFHHGRLRVGEAMAPPLIRQVRAKADSTKDTIIDAPPGTSCPVITAMRDTDFILLVTEPTPFGLHDLKLAVEAVRVLGIPHGLIINRCDMGDEGVERYAEEESLPILMQIPFDLEIARAYSQGIPFVKVTGAWKEKFERLFEDIKDLSAAGRQQ